MWVKRFETEFIQRGAVGLGLRREGIWYLTSSYEHRLWASVFLRLWQLYETRYILKSLGNEWIKLHPCGRRAAEVSHILGLTALPPALALQSTLTRKASRTVADSKLLESIELFVAREGIVEKIADYGIFINIGVAVGLLHVSDLPIAHAANIREFYERGNVMQVVAKSVDHETRKITLGFAVPPPSVWPKHFLDELNVGGTVDAIVVKVLPRHGIFVNACKIIGIVPEIQVPEAYRRALAKNYSIGQTLRLKILTIDRQWERVEFGIIDS